MKRLMRSSNRIFAGVLGGVANYFDFDPVWVRLAFILFALIFNVGTALLIYIIAMIIMPHGDHNVYHSDGSPNDMKERLTDRRTITILGLVLVLVGIAFLFDQIYHIQLWTQLRFYYYDLKKYLWPAALIILGLWIIVRGRNK